MSEHSASSPALRIATRGSRLALWQAHHVADLLRAATPGRAVEIVTVSTIGDRDKTEALTQLGGSGGTGVFTREVQAALLDGRADIAVHSLKDLPTEAVAGLTLAAVPQRGPLFDVLVLRADGSGQRAAGSDEQAAGSRQQTAELHQDTTAQDSSCASLPSAICHLPSSSIIGSGSPRRKAQLLHQRPDLRFVEARGNVETRLRKLDEGEFDALILAEAGLTRLELADRISAPLIPPLLLPAVGQGALGIECRTDDAGTRAALSRLIDRETYHAVLAERAVLATLRAGCHAPLGVWTRPDGDSLRLTAVVLSLDGTQRFECERSVLVTTEAEAEALGRSVAEDLLSRGAAKLLRS